MRKYACACAVASLIFLIASCVFAQVKAEDNRDQKAKALLEKANSLIQERNNNEAITALEEALKMEPRWAALHYSMGLAYSNRFFATRNQEDEQKAIASLRKTIELESRNPDARQLLAQINLAGGRIEEAIRESIEAIKISPTPSASYRIKWRAMLKRADFEKEIPAIRTEVEAILKSDLKREEALLAASFGYEAIADDEGRKRIDDLVLAEFPGGDWARRISRSRAFAETDRSKQEALLESFLARYTDDPNRAQLFAALFRLKSVKENLSGDGLARLGEDWIQSTRGKAYDTVRAIETVAVVLAERKLGLDRAQLMSDEAVRIADSFNLNSQGSNSSANGQRASNAGLLNEMAHATRGFVLLRRGRVDDALKEFTVALEPVIKRVESHGYILWKDIHLREVGVRPRVLWLAEAYEAQGDYPRAAKYLLAGYGDDERANDFIRSRLPLVYQKLGRTAQEAVTALEAARLRYSSMTEKTPAAVEEEKKRLLASRVNTLAPDFKVTTLDKKEIQLSDLKGKVIVLNFWATWCGPCIKELPYFQKVVEKYKSNADVVFLAVSIDDNRAAVRPFVEKNRYAMNVAYDVSAAQKYKVHNIPAMIIIDRDGLIQYREEGFGGEGTSYEQRLIWRVDELLANKPVGITQAKER